MEKIVLLLLIILLVFPMFSGCNCVASEIPAPVESIDILILESFPVQIKIMIDGYLPNPCCKLSQIKQCREGNSFYITIMMKENALPCIQVIEPYQEVVDLEVYGLPVGNYQVNVNGVIQNFTLEVDNILVDIIK